jgi:5'-nucleotidase
MKPLILLTNDDGFFAEGIQILRESVSELGDAYIVAPDRERSATSLALTLHHPLRVKRTSERVFAVDGTPADCIYLALQKLLPRKPDLILSGINPGPNLGQQDISYSGTVAGAVQGTFLQITSAALSCLPDKDGTCHFDIASRFAKSLAQRLLKNKLPQGITLNINIPPPPLKGIKSAKLGEKRYNPEILVKKDPRQRDYYWIGTGNPKATGDHNSDVRVIEDGYITVTPLHRDLTDYDWLDSSGLDSHLNGLQDEMA